MPIRASVTNAETLTISGLDPIIPKAKWKVWLKDIAEIIEERIAAHFEREDAAGKPLKRNRPGWTQEKAEEGADLRRGHMFGDLQDGIDKGGFDTITQSKRGASIKFDENKLYNRVPHARHYAAQKVHGERILVVLQQDARMAEKFLTARAREFVRGEERQLKRPRRNAKAQTFAKKLLQEVVRFLRRL